MPSEAERQMLHADLAEHRRCLEPARPDEIAKAYGTLGSILPDRNQSDSENDMAAKLWRNAVADIPLDILNAACNRAVRECEWFPRPAKIREFAEPELNKRANRVWMMERLIEQRHPTDDHGPMADPAEVRALISKARAA